MWKQKIALPVAHGYEFANVAEIVRCQAEGNYTNIVLETGKEILVSKNLGLFEELLSPWSFLRVHRAHLINLQHLTGYVRGKGGYAIMSDGCEVEVSNRKKQDLLTSLPLAMCIMPKQLQNHKEGEAQA